MKCDPMKIYALRFNHEGILMDMFFSDLSKPQNVIILAYGMPGLPVQKDTPFVMKAVEEGFTVVAPNYIGTFDSYGKFDIENAVTTIVKTAEFVSKGEGKNMLKDSVVNWKTKSITLLGWSFGGSVVLVAGAKSKYVNKIVAISTPTDYRTHAKLYEEENLEGLSKMMSLLYPNTWRIESNDAWSKFLEGKLDLNAIDHITELDTKEILLIHGLNDTVANSKRSESLYKELSKNEFKKELLLLKDKGHMDVKNLDEKELFDKIVSFIGKDSGY